MIQHYSIPEEVCPVCTAVPCAHGGCLCDSNQCRKCLDPEELGAIYFGVDGFNRLIQKLGA